METVRLLLDQPDIQTILNTADQYGQTPLYMALKHGYDQIVILLLEAGADIPPDIPQFAQKPFIFRGTQQRKRQLLKLLIKRPSRQKQQEDLPADHHSQDDIKRPSSRKKQQQDLPDDSQSQGDSNKSQKRGQVIPPASASISSDAQTLPWYKKPKYRFNGRNAR
jgi:hypothetical protein